MPYTRATAARLLTASELDLFDAARRDRIAAHDARQLRGKISRARRLRDKYGDLYQRQRRASGKRSGDKAGRTRDENVCTQKKSELFAEVLVRFETRLGKLQAAQARAEARTSRTPKPKAEPATARRGPTAKPAGRQPAFMSEAARGANARGLTVRTGNVAVQAHVSSRGRRNQAKRDRHS